MKVFIDNQVIIYNNRNSMGNTQQSVQTITNKYQIQPGNLCDVTNQYENSVRCSFGENLADNANTIQQNKNGKGRQGKGHKSLDSKSKQKLSLCKQANTQSSIRLKLNRSASNDCRGIGLTQVEKTISQYRTAIVNNKHPVRINFHQAEPTIKKIPIRPRDLPRKVSTEKIIIFPQSTIKRVPLEPRIIINPPSSSPCIINYTKRPQNLTNSNHSNHSLQASIVTPFVPPRTTTPCNQYLLNAQEPKKLKKVALNRSHTNYNTFEREQNNGEECEPNKQNEKKGKGQSLLVQSRYNDESIGQQLFTDPKLYAYLTNKEHACSREIKSKYALPSSEGRAQQKRSIIFQKHAKTPSLSIAPTTNAPLRLQEAIPDEVESKPYIQTDIYRFPTLSDFSEDGKTDNTSFIPIIRNNSSQKHTLEGEELLKYCRPKIDQMVLADLRKLPLKD